MLSEPRRPVAIDLCPGSPERPRLRLIVPPDPEMSTWACDESEPDRPQPDDSRFDHGLANGLLIVAGIWAVAGAILVWRVLW